MSTRAKYGWAFGLIIIGIALAFPFRRAQEGEQTVQDDVALVDHQSTVTERNDSSSGKNGSVTNASQPDNDSSIVRHHPLLPGTRREILNSDQQNRQPTNEPNPAGQLVEQVPGQFPPQSNGELVDAQRHDEPGKKFVEQDDRPASLRPVDFSRKPTNRQMPESVGPYRMKKVPSSRFLAASQSSSGQKVFSQASRTRKVIHYRLRDGDSLRSIAQRYLGDASRYEEILQDNRHVLTNGENFLPVGQYITIVVQ